MITVKYCVDYEYEKINAELSLQMALNKNGFNALQGSDLK